MNDRTKALQLAKRVSDHPDDWASDIVLVSQQLVELMKDYDKLAGRNPRTFPIQRSTPIPYVLAQRAYDTYARLYGASQSLERLGERGGFGLQEFACLFNGHEPDSSHYQCVQKADAVGRHITNLEETVEKLKGDLATQLDPMTGLIHANRDEILRKHEEAVRRIAKQLDRAALSGTTTNRWRQFVLKAKEVIEALNKFHPMHAESWPGWPEGSE